MVLVHPQWQPPWLVGASGAHLVSVLCDDLRGYLCRRPRKQEMVSSLHVGYYLYALEPGVGHHGGSRATSAAMVPRVSPT